MPHSRLLMIPFELRDVIWSFAAINGSWTRLLRTCRLFHEELQPHCKLPDRLESLERMVIRVDPNYVQGTWLEVQCIWHTGRGYRHLTLPVQNMDDPIVGRLWDIGGGMPEHIDIHLVAPSRGHVWGDFLVMLVKTDDAVSLIKWMAPRHYKWDVPSLDRPIIRVLFDSDVQASPNWRRSFWECWCAREFNNGHLPPRRDMVELPCLYEYFMDIASAELWPGPKFVFAQPLTMGRLSTYTDNDDDADAHVDDRPGFAFNEIAPIVGVNYRALYRLLYHSLNTRKAPQGGSLDVLQQHHSKTRFLSPDNSLSDHSSWVVSRPWWAYAEDEDDFIL